MRTAEATRVVQRELQKPLEQPITVKRGTTRFTLSAEDAGVKADVGGMVDEALAGEPRRHDHHPRRTRHHRR